MFSLKSFCRFNFCLLVLVITGLIVSNSAFSQFQLETNYSGVEPNPPETPQTLITVDDETQSPHTLFGGFYTTRNGLKSNLLINNKGPRPIEIAPTLYGEGGGILQIPRMTVERNSAITINLSDWANLGGEGFQQGNIRLFHRGKVIPSRESSRVGNSTSNN